jgi:hypothetical protein
MLRMCGRYADGWLPGQKVDAAEYAGRLSIIREGAGKAGDIRGLTSEIRDILGLIDRGAG